MLLLALWTNFLKGNHLYYKIHLLSKFVLHFNNLLSDPTLWENVSSFHPNDQDEIRRVYLQRGSCQPLGHDFPKKEFSGALRWFNPSYFCNLLQRKFWTNRLLQWSYQCNNFI